MALLSLTPGAAAHAAPAVTSAAQEVLQAQAPVRDAALQLQIV